MDLDDAAAEVCAARRSRAYRAAIISGLLLAAVASAWAVGGATGPCRPSSDVARWN